MISIVYSKDYKNHSTGNHPENNTRITSIMDAVHEQIRAGSMDEIPVLKPEAASKNDLVRVHSEEHVERIRSFCREGGGYLGFDTFASPETYNTAKLAAGSAIIASKLVLDGQDCSYSIARPPGHHATIDRSMGFCFFNNMAVAIEHLREVHGVGKFFIFDFDVHYGNGTAEIFYNDPDVLYISIHQDPRTIFPGKGFVEEIGAGKGEGCNLNIPMPPGSGTRDYMYVLDRILEPAAAAFDADLHFLDVGFDCHLEDPLSNMGIDDAFFPWIGAKMRDIAGSMVLVLEGGYNLKVLRRCNVKLINVLNTEVSTEELSDMRNTKSYLYRERDDVDPKTKTLFKDIQDTFSPFFEF